MTTASELLDLAERCEAATGSDNDLRIAILTHPVFGYRDIHGDGSMFDRGNDGYWYTDDEAIRQLPDPTASLDAATSLFPSGTMYRSGHSATGPDPSLFFCDAVTDAPLCADVHALAFTEANARSACALRARAAQMEA